MKRIIPAVFLLLSILILSGLIGFRQTKFRDTFPDVTVQELQNEETGDTDNCSYNLSPIETTTQNNFQNVTLKIEPGTLYSSRTLISSYPQATQYVEKTRIEGRETKYLLFPVSFTNSTNEIAKILLPDFQLQTELKNVYIEPSLYEIINGTNLSMQVDPQSTQTTMMTYVIGNEGFTSAEWADFDNRDFDLVLFFYPNKYTVTLIIKEY